MAGEAAPVEGPGGGVNVPSMASYLGASSRYAFGDACFIPDKEDLEPTRGSAAFCPTMSFVFTGNVAKRPPP